MIVNGRVVLVDLATSEQVAELRSASRCRRAIRRYSAGCFRFLFRHGVYLSGCRAVMRRAAALDFPLFSGHIRQRGAISYVDD
jgi:hypothetical protein